MTDDPCRKAYLLLSQIDVGPELGSARGPLLEFHEAQPSRRQQRVGSTAKDKLSLSLLQARLIDLRMPIKIVEA